MFTQPDRPAGRGQALHASPVKCRALELGLPVHQPASFKSPEALEILRGLSLDALVVVAYGLILPRRRARDPQAGLHQHPCLAAAAMARRGADSAGAARGRCADRHHHHAHGGRSRYRAHAGGSRKSRSARATRRKRCTTGSRELGAELIVETLGELARAASAKCRSPPRASRTPAKIDKAEAVIDWRQDAAQISRQVRAFNPWPIAETRFDGAQLRIWEAEPLHRRPGAEAAPGTVLGTRRPKASTSPAAGGVLANSAPAARGPQAACRAGIHPGTASSTASASRAHEEPRAPARDPSPRMRWREYCARA